MKIKKNYDKPELMAPAGDWTMLHAAINAGADAVYFGVDKLNMRAKAKNFFVEELPEISKFCRSKPSALKFSVLQLTSPSGVMIVADQEIATLGC